MRTSHDVSDTHVCGQVSLRLPQSPVSLQLELHRVMTPRRVAGGTVHSGPSAPRARPRGHRALLGRARARGGGGGSLATLARPSARPSHTVCWLRLRLSHALTVIFKRNNGIQHDTTHERHVACVGRVTPDTHPERYAPRTNWQLPRTPGTRGQTARMAMTI